MDYISYLRNLRVVAWAGRKDVGGQGYLMITWNTYIYIYTHEHSKYVVYLHHNMHIGMLAA